MRASRLFSTGPVLAAFSLMIQSPAADWPNYRGPNHNGTSPEKISASPNAAPRELWKVPTPNGFSSFAVKNGRAFTQITRDVDGVPMEVLIALHADTGKELWSFPVGMPRYGHDGGNAGARNNSGGDGPRSTPTLEGDRVYVLSSDLVLHCLESENGKPLWKRDIIRQHDGQNITWKNAASPLIEGDLVFLAGGGQGQALLAFNKTNGELVWKGEDDKMTHATPTPATIHGIRQIIFFTQKGLVAVKPENGAVLWRHPYPFNVSTAASPVVDQDVVYCSAGYGVGSTAIQVAKDGDRFSVKELWRVKGDKLANHWSTPVLHEGHLYGMFQFKEYGTGPVKCVELRTGKEKWSQPGFGPGNVILANGQLLILGDAGQLVVADATPERYQEKARFQAITGKCWSTPALSNGRVYVRSTKEGAAFDFSTRFTER